MRWLIDHGIPAYGAPDLAVNAMAALREYAHMRELNAEEDEALRTFRPRSGSANDRPGSRRWTQLPDRNRSQTGLCGLRSAVTKTDLATSEDEAVELAKKIGFPVVMKIVSPDILHKSDAGGVKVNIKDEAAVREAYRTILANAKNYKADANIHGIAIQEMAPWGTEVILGSVNDPTFGPTMMFGLGGIFVEVLKDVTFRVAPVASNQALRMLGEIRGAPILAGVRGEKPRDKAALAETICRYSTMILDLADEIAESDANPVLVYEEGKGAQSRRCPHHFEEEVRSALRTIKNPR